MQVLQISAGKAEAHRALNQARSLLALRQVGFEKTKCVPLCMLEIQIDI